MDSRIPEMDSGTLSRIVAGVRRRLFLKQQRRKLMQAPPPRLPLVRRLRRDVPVRVDPRLLERLHIRLRIAAKRTAAPASAAPAAGGVDLAAAVAHEHELDLLLVRR